MNTVTRCILLLACTGFSAATAIAQSVSPAVAQAPPSRFVIGARLGYGIAIGEVMADWAIRDTIKATVPLRIEFGYKLSPNLQVGGYGQFGYGFLGTSQRDFCEIHDTFCWAWVLQIAGDTEFHLRPSATADPWLGLGLGLEWASTRDEANDDVKTWTGWFAEFQTGLDLRQTDTFRLGPFSSFSVGQYRQQRDSYRDSTYADDGEIPNKSWHAWLTIGVRGTFTL